MWDEYHGLVEGVLARGRWSLELDDLKGLFQLKPFYDSMKILFFMMYMELVIKHHQNHNKLYYQDLSSIQENTSRKTLSI